MSYGTEHAGIGSPTVKEQVERLFHSGCRRDAYATYFTAGRLSHMPVSVSAESRSFEIFLVETPCGVMVPDRSSYNLAIHLSGL